MNKTLPPDATYWEQLIYRILKQLDNHTTTQSYKKLQTNNRTNKRHNTTTNAYKQSIQQLEHNYRTLQTSTKSYKHDTKQNK